MIDTISFILSIALLIMLIEAYAKSKRLDREMKELRRRIEDIGRK